MSNAQVTRTFGSPPVGLIGRDGLLHAVNETWLQEIPLRVGDRCCGSGVGIPGLSREEADRLACGIEKVLQGSSPSYQCEYTTGGRNYLLAVSRLGIDGGAAIVRTELSSGASMLPSVASDYANLGVFLTDAEGRCTYWNSPLRNICGVHAQMPSAAGWTGYVHPDERGAVLQSWYFAITGGRSFQQQFRIQNVRGEIVLVEARCAPVLSPRGETTGFIGTVEDLTGRKHMEEQLVHSQKMEAVGRLAGGVAHDFANLLTLISGYSEILLSRVGKDDPLRPELEEIRKAANRGSGLTNQLLAFSRKQAVEQRSINLNRLVEDMQQMLLRMIGENINLEADLDPNPGLVKADPGQIEQIVMNLVVNARDAMPEGGTIRIHTGTVAVDHERARTQPGLDAGSYVQLQFADTGQGMDEETLSHIFEPFFTTKEKGKGTGLGLSTVYAIVKQSRGHVTVDSTLGKGTTITVYLPLIAMATSEPAAVEAPAAKPVAGNETILLVEDEAGVRKLLKYILLKRGYTVLEAGDPREALRICEDRTTRVDLLLTDIVMPHMSGRELARHVQEIRPGIKVIYMSGYTDDVLMRTGAIGPGMSFLQKPLKPEVLSAKIREVLDQPAAQSHAGTAAMS